jgi:hypothetical protein
MPKCEEETIIGASKNIDRVSINTTRIEKGLRNIDTPK